MYSINVQYMSILYMCLIPVSGPDVIMINGVLLPPLNKTLGSHISTLAYYIFLKEY